MGYRPKKYNQSFHQEFKRVIIHGALHLCGYNDCDESEKLQMTSMENNYLSKAFLHSKMHTFMKEKQGYFYFLTFNFIHNGKKLFYSLSTDNLSDLEITKFISYGVKKKTIKILMLPSPITEKDSQMRI